MANSGRLDNTLVGVGGGGGELPLGGLTLRALKSSDLEPLKVVHQQLFPIDYEHEFYHKAVHGLDRIVGWVAVTRGDAEQGGEQIAGFITARTQDLADADEVERGLLGWEPRVMLGQCRERQRSRQLMYVLTLGVLNEWRHKGLGRHLVAQVIDQAGSMPLCRAVFLHVITHNRAAIAFYHSLQFECVQLLPRFYYIHSERLPTPGVHHYDALLFVHYVNSGRPPFSPLKAFSATHKCLRDQLSQLSRWLGKACAALNCLKGMFGSSAAKVQGED